ncbi:MAG: RNA-binding protein hfq [Prochloron sp. SP5CPC1]|nr:RNA-binding protein hfq [Candidatus Paraprochloron terpiosi SP5CPC1]
MTKFNPGLPSIRQIQNFIKDKKKVELKLITGDTLVGKIMWQDDNCLCLSDQYQQLTLIWLQGIVYLKAQ